MIFAQKQPPLIYTPANGRCTPEVETFLKDLAKEVKSTMRDGRSFKGLGIKQDLVQLLKSNNITKPTQVQIDSIPELLKGRNAIIQSVTGSGKTLTFVLPLMQNLSSHSCSNIIIVPTRELA